MDQALKKELIQIEQQIKKLCPAKDEFEQDLILRKLSGAAKEHLESLLRNRKHLLNRMLLCTPAEMTRMEEVNTKLFDLTRKLYDKTYSLYKALLQTGYDPDFDDDIMIEGVLHYSFNDEESVLPMDEDEAYGSDFKWMMSLIDTLDYISYGHDQRPCARTFISYNAKDRPDMTAKELHLENTLDDGVSWDDGGLFKDICVCHAVYSLCDNAYSYPDILRMNDFWCEVKVTHQLITDLKGKRYSYCENRN